jgi:hypothetical protein
MYNQLLKNDQELRIDLPDDDDSPFDDMVYYLYHGEIYNIQYYHNFSDDDESQRIARIYQIASKFQIKGLKDLVLEKLRYSAMHDVYFFVIAATAIVDDPKDDKALNPFVKEQIVCLIQLRLSLGLDVDRGFKRHMKKGGPFAKLVDEAIFEARQGFSPEADHEQTVTAFASARRDSSPDSDPPASAPGFKQDHPPPDEESEDSWQEWTGFLQVGNGVAFAVQDYQARLPWELSFRRGDRITDLVCCCPLLPWRSSSFPTRACQKKIRNGRAQGSGMVPAAIGPVRFRISMCD